MKFGKYIERKRKNGDISLREFAREIGISAAYLSDIEKEKKPAPSGEILNKISQCLKLKDDELMLFHDLAAATRNDIAEDIKTFLMENKPIQTLIRNIKINTIDLSIIKLSDLDFKKELL